MSFGLAGAGVRHLGHLGASPGWLGYAVIAVLLLAACVALWFAVSPGRRSGEDDSPGADGGERRRGPAGGPTPSHPSPGGDPEWWPEFERQFAAYVNRSPGERSLIRA